jgi:hypothetical protein
MQDTDTRISTWMTLWFIRAVARRAGASLPLATRLLVLPPAGWGLRLWLPFAGPAVCGGGDAGAICRPPPALEAGCAASHLRGAVVLA